MSLEDYVNNYYQMAANVASPGVPISLILTHSFLESGRGDSLLTKKGFNFFGVKALPGEPSLNLQTKEVINGKEVTIYQKFKSYPNAQASFADYVRLLNKPRYISVRQAATVPEKFTALGRSGYFTAGNSYIKTATTISQAVEKILASFNPNILPSFLIGILALSIALLNK